MRMSFVACPLLVAAVWVVAGCANPAPMAAPSAALRSQLLCGDKSATVVFQGDTARLEAGGRSLTLQQVRSASGARYEAVGDPTTWLWNKGPVTTLSLQGETWPECRAAAA